MSALFNLLLHAVSLGCSIAIIGVVWGIVWESPSWESYWPWGRRYYYTSDYTVETCLMAPLNTGANICGYMSVVAGLSIALTVFFLIYKGLQLCRRRRPGAPKPSFSSLELILCVFGLVWWIAAAITATIYGERADDAGLKEEDARTAVWSLAWANTFLFLVLLTEQLILYYSSSRKVRYPAPPMGAAVGEPPLPQFSMAAPPAGPIPESPFVVPGYPAAPASSTIQMYGGYPLATEPPPPTYSR